MSEYDKEAVLKVLEFLHRIEPTCGRCDQCRYYNDREKCEESKEKARIEHIEWEEKIKKWENRLNGSSH